MDQRLTQDDFRKLLMTPRSVPQQKPSPKPAGNQTRNPEKKVQRPPKPGLGSEENKEDAEGYRDRAKERREGKLGEYEESHRILSTVMETDNPDISKLSYDQSKYLGGDIEHTHLVKGLDFALLEKVKKEMEQDGSSEDSSAPRDDDGSKIQFQTQIGKKIHAAAFAKPKGEKNEHFFPGRMFFRFELDEDFGSEIPTNVIRSKAEFKEYQSKMVTPSNDLVVNKIVQLFTHFRQGMRAQEPTKKLKKKEKQEKEKAENQEPVALPAPLPKKPVIDMDDDIFPDAGKYVLEFNEKEKAPSAKTDNEARPKSYFDKPPSNEEEDTTMDDPLLTSLPKNLSIEGAQFAFPEPRPKTKVEAETEAKSSKSISSDQISAISSIVKTTVQGFKESQKRLREDEEKREEREKREAEERQRREAEEKEKREAEEMKRLNEFRVAGMPMQYSNQKTKTDLSDSYESFMYDSDEDSEIPRTKEEEDQEEKGPKKGKKTEKDKFSRSAVEVGKIMEKKYGANVLASEKPNKKRKAED